MPCGCGKTKKYLVTTAAGEKQTVDSLTAAIQIVRAKGGHYQPVKV